MNNHLALLRKMFNVAVEWEFLDSAPRIKALKVPRSDFDFLDFGEAERLLNAAEEQGDRMVRVVLGTGLRRGELLGLQQDDVDLVAKRMLVRRNIVHGKVESPKSGKWREIPLSDSVLAALKANRHLRGKYVFCDGQGKVMPLKEMYSRLHFYCRKAGLRKIGWHVLRHSFASHLVMKGAPLKVVQELLGHSTIEMTMRYAHMSPDVKRDYVNLLEDLRHKSGTTGGDVKKGRDDGKMSSRGNS